MRLPSSLAFVSTALLTSLIACGGSTEPASARPFEVVYRQGTSEGDKVTAINPDGTGKRLLATPSDEAYCASLSSDGNRLVYDGIRTNQIIVLDLRSNTETQVTRDSLRSQCPVWSPDGTKIAFFRGPNTAPNGMGLYVMSADGSNVRQFAPDGYTWGGIDWSPDGRWLAATTMDRKLVLVEATTGVIGGVVSATDGWQPNFSPDGKEIAYNLQTGNDVDVYVSNVDGSNRRKLTTSTQLDSYHYGPHWSPDGRTIAYLGYAPNPVPGTLVNSVWAVFLVSRDGVPVQWKDGAMVYGYQPLWRYTQ